MAVIRHPDSGVNTENYIATLAFFCCVSGIIVMLKFGRFKASFKVFNGDKNKSSKHEEVSKGLSIVGAYRTNRDEYFTYNNYSESQRKLTPSAPVVPAPPPPPPLPQTVPLRQSKSTSDILRDKNLSPVLKQAQSGISLDPRGAESENRNSRHPPPVPKKSKKPLDAEKKVQKQKLEEQKKAEKLRQEEQKKAEKQRLAEQKKQEIIALQEQAKQEKVKKEKKKEKKTKKPAPPKPLANPLAQTSTQAGNNLIAQSSTSQYSTNTLDSSISKTSGPPPYTEFSKREINTNENNGNVSFGAPVDGGSWDMVSKHRQKVGVNKRVAAASAKGQTKIDLNYTLAENNSRDNSEA